MNPRLQQEAGSCVLALNAGGSSLKFALYAEYVGFCVPRRGIVSGISGGMAQLHLDGMDRAQERRIDDHAGAAAWVIDTLLDDPATAAIVRDRLVATVHRVVHGGTMFTGPTLVDEASLERIESLAPLAPLHNPPATAVMALVRERLAGLPMVAVFDTSFFQALPEHAARYAVPENWFAERGIRRYGFHGIAHEYMRDRLSDGIGNGPHSQLGDRWGDRHGERPGHRPRAWTEAGVMPARAVTLQLGHGCSVTALRDGKPVETSMGFTPLEGLVMTTRAGDIDAGAVLEMLRAGHSRAEIDHALNHESGLRGLSGVSDDVRELLSLEATGHPGATLALRIFCNRIIKYLGAYAAVLGGLDAIAFGGGIGENAAPLRVRICAGLEWLGLRLDAHANAACDAKEGIISKPGSPVLAAVVPVREDELMARQAFELLRARQRAGMA